MNLTVDRIFAQTKDVDTKSLRLKKKKESLKIILELLIEIRFFCYFFSKFVVLPFILCNVCQACSDAEFVFLWSNKVWISLISVTRWYIPPFIYSRVPVFLRICYISLVSMWAHLLSQDTWPPSLHKKPYLHIRVCCRNQDVLFTTVFECVLSWQDDKKSTDETLSCSELTLRSYRITGQ